MPGSASGTLKYAGLLLLVTLIGAFFGIVMHTLIVRSWLIALYGTMKMVTRKVVQMGHVLPRRVPTGEVLSVASADSDEFGALTEIVSRVRLPARSPTSWSRSSCSAPRRSSAS